ncbi:MAG: hypothetical protein NDI62_03565 [Burkholderiales bacterium]|nr:hypothetical protein [Burkholderiales bacterium]
MKFNFENIKKVVKTGTILGGAALIPFSSTIEKGNNNSEKELSELNKEEISHTINVGEFKDYAKLPTIKGFYEAEEKYQGGKENVILLQDISNLENQFSKLSKGKADIEPGSFAIISRLDLAGKGIEDEFSEKIKSYRGEDVTSFSPLNNALITREVSGIVEDSTINNQNSNHNTKIFSTDLNSRKEVNKFSEHINISDYKYNRPAYYFVIAQEHDENSITLKLKTISSKDEKVIDEFSFKEELPDGDRFGQIFDDLVKKDIAPKLAQKIQEKIHEYKLDQNNDGKGY